MIAGYVESTPDDPFPYRVVVRRLGEIVRVQPVCSRGEGDRILTQLISREREYEVEGHDQIEPRAHGD